MTTRVDVTGSAHDDMRWKRGSWLVLIVSVLLVTSALISLAYRLSLATDGWVINDENEFESYAILGYDALGLGSSLQPGDDVLRVEGIADTAILFTEGVNQLALDAQWRPGATVEYVVQRADQTLTVPVTLGQWTLSGFLGAHGERVPLLVLETVRVFLHLLVGAYVFARRPGSAGAQVLFFLGAIEIVMWLALLLPYGIGDVLDSFAIVPVLLLGYYSWGILLFPSILLLALVFPKPKFPIRKYPVLTLLFLYLIVGALVFAVGFGSELSATIGFGSVAVFGLLTIASVIHTVIVARHDAVRRAQVSWVGMGLAIVAGTLVLNNAAGLLPDSSDVSDAGFAGFWGNAAFTLLRLALPAALAIAILRFRLFDIDVIIRRTLTYGALTLLLGAIYAGVITVLQQGLAALTGSGDSQLATVASTLAVAGAFLPLRNRVQAFVDRRFYRSKYDAVLVAARFAAEMRDTVTMDDVTTKLFDAVEDTMQPGKMALWVAEGDTSGHKIEVGTR